MQRITLRRSPRLGRDVEQAANVGKIARGSKPPGGHRQRIEEVAGLATMRSTRWLIAQPSIYRLYIAGHKFSRVWGGTPCNRFGQERPGTLLVRPDHRATAQLGALRLHLQTPLDERFAAGATRTKKLPERAAGLLTPANPALGGVLVERRLADSHRRADIRGRPERFPPNRRQQSPAGQDRCHAGPAVSMH